MNNLIEPQNTIKFLKEHGISAKKRYGQNFLIDKRVLDRIIAGSDITGNDTVLEIGPGIGTMTQALCEAAGRVIAVEIDKDMIPVLQENLSAYDNYSIINEDVLKLDLGKLLSENEDGTDRAENTADDAEAAAAAFSDNDAEDPSVDVNADAAGDICAAEAKKTGKVKVAANLPYYITTPIIMQLLENELPIESITVMVQKEVADRMQAKPGGKDYGALTLAVQYRAEARVIANVPPNCFIPRPGVDSAVIRLCCYDEPPVRAANENRLFEVIKAAFARRRETLANALKNAPKLNVSREQVENALTEMGLPVDVRGERLSLKEFAGLTDRLF